MSVPRVLAVETDADSLNVLHQLCDRWQAPLDVVGDASAGLERLAKIDYALVLSAVSLPGMTGLELVEHIKRRQAELPVVLLADDPGVTEAVRAIKLGASDYIDKPLSRETLELSITGLVHGLGGVDDEHRNSDGPVATAKTGKPGPHRPARSHLLTNNKMMIKAVNHAMNLANVHAPVLLEGEPGVGKSLLAREIHRQSRRRGPFVEVACSMLAEYMLASELFGHVRGAFSGADRDRRGKLEAANGGVLFVDGIAEASLALQRRLLRTLEDGVIERLGEDRPMQVDVKMVVATSRNLAELVWDGKFCEPLYHRLNVAKVNIPPLRHRKDDIGTLARNFLERFHPATAGRPKEFSDACIKVLEEYSWPGNVGELESVVQTASSLCPKGVTVIKRDHLPTMLTNKPVAVHRLSVNGGTESVGHNTALSYLLGQRERTFVEQALAATNYNIQHSAKLLRISRPTLYAKMKRFGLNRVD